MLCAVAGLCPSCNCEVLRSAWFVNGWKPALQTVLTDRLQKLRRTWRPVAPDPIRSKDNIWVEDFIACLDDHFFAIDRKDWMLTVRQVRRSKANFYTGAKGMFFQCPKPPHVTVFRYRSSKTTPKNFKNQWKRQNLLLTSLAHWVLSWKSLKICRQRNLLWRVWRIGLWKSLNI